MFKRILAVALAIVMVMSMAVIAASAAEVSNSAGADTSSEATGTSGVLYFDATGWNNVSQIYCHIWVNGGDAFYAWKASAEKCTKVSGSLWSFDLSILDDSTTVSGGLKAGEDYCVIFHADTGLQTYDATLGTACIGDRMKLTGEKIENPVDSEKEGYEAVWSKNSAKFGPHLAISSVGNFLGDVLCPNESGTKVIGDWLVAYSDSQYCDPVEVLAKALKKFNVKDIEAVYAYILTKDLGISNPDTMLDQLEKAYTKAYGQKATIDKTAAEKKSQTIKDNGGDTSSVSQDEAESSSSSSTTSGSTGGSGSTTTSSQNYSGSANDGQEDTLFFVLAAVMLLAAGAFVVSRKRTEV